MSDIPGRLRAGFMLEARETLEESARLCERAERLRDDLVRLHAGLKIAPDGETLELLDRRLSAASLTLAIDRFCEAALQLGQATWSWAQAIEVEAGGDRAGFERKPASLMP